MSSDEDASNVASSEGEDLLQDLKYSIESQLRTIEAAGTFATSGTCNNITQPGISVKGVGLLRLPLSCADATKIIAASRKSPFGKGNKTIIDPSVRNTWEIDAGQIIFENKAWQQWLDGLVATVAVELGVLGGSEGVRAELYKMLLYEKGAMFKPHKDTEKEEGMFGTLLICLPSEHEGGAVRAIHGGKQRLFSTASSSGFSTSYIAWYADVAHEIEPVQSGYRWVLTYNLIKDKYTFPQSASGLDARTRRFQAVLDSWSTRSPIADFLCYALDHQYTDASLKLSNLKGHDHARVRTVQDACRANGDFYVFLANLETVETWPDDDVVSGGDGDEDAEGVDWDLRLRRVLDLEGHPLSATALCISASLLIQSYMFSGRDPDRQTGGEYTGNQHADIDRYYNDTVMILLPKDRAMISLLGTGHNAQNLRDFLNILENAVTHRQDAISREMIVDTCNKHLVHKWSSSETKDRFLGPVACSAMFLKDEELWRKVIGSATHSFSEPIYHIIGYRAYAAKLAEKDLASALSLSPHLSTRWRCLKQYRTGYIEYCAERDLGHDVIQELGTWVESQTLQALNTIEGLNPEDAGTLIELATSEYAGGIKASIDTLLLKYLHFAAFANAWIVELLSALHTSNIEKSSDETDKNASRKSIVTKLLSDSLDPGMSLFELSQFSSKKKREHGSLDFPYSSWPKCNYSENRGDLDASLVVMLYRELAASKRQKQAPKLLDKIHVQVIEVPIEELDRLVIPLLRQFLEVLDATSVEHQDLCLRVLQVYSLRMVQMEPVKPQDWYRGDEWKVNCNRKSCAQCDFMVAFLQDPDRQSATYSSPKQNLMMPHKSWLSPGDGMPHQRWSLPNELDFSFTPTDDTDVLNVTKTLRGWDMQHKEWTRRAETAQKGLQKLPKDLLKQFLRDHYDAIMNLNIVKLQTSDVKDMPGDSKDMPIRTDKADEKVEESEEPPRKKLRSGKRIQ